MPSQNVIVEAAIAEAEKRIVDCAEMEPAEFKQLIHDAQTDKQTIDVIAVILLTRAIVQYHT